MENETLNWKWLHNICSCETPKQNNNKIRWFWRFCKFHTSGFTVHNHNKSFDRLPFWQSFCSYEWYQCSLACDGHGRWSKVVQYKRLGVSSSIESWNTDYISSGLCIAAAAFLTGIAGVSVVAGFSKTVMSAKKHDPSVFEAAQKGEVALLEGGTRLAARALAIGSLLAVVGVGGLCFTFWKLTGAKTVRHIYLTRRRSTCSYWIFWFSVADGWVFAEDEFTRTQGKAERSTKK